MNIKRFVKNAVSNTEEMKELGELVKYLESKDYNETMQIVFAYEYGKKIGKEKAANPVG